MNRTHTAVIALALAVAAVLGATAAMRTVGLGQNASTRPSVSSAAIAARTHRLDKIEAALRQLSPQPAAEAAARPCGAPAGSGCRPGHGGSAARRLPAPGADRHRQAPPQRRGRGVR